MDFAALLEDNTIPHFHRVWDLQDPAQTQDALHEILRLIPVTVNAHDTALEVKRAEIATQTARALGLQSKFDDAERALQEAAQVLTASYQDRLTENEIATLRARIALERGRLLRSAGHVAKAIPLFKEAFNTTHLIEELDYFTVDALHMTALVLETPEEKEMVTVNALEYARTSKNPNTRTWAAPLLNNKAWDEMDAGRYERAIPLFKEAADLREEQYKQTTQQYTDVLAQTKTLRVWRLGRYYLGHALRLAGETKAALKTQEALLASGHDGVKPFLSSSNYPAKRGAQPYLREELALLKAGCQSGADTLETPSAVDHARQAFALGFSEQNSSTERVAKLKGIIDGN